MPFVAYNRTRLSDLVQNELDPAVGYSRQDINVTPPANAGEVVMGTVVFRAKATPSFNNTENATFTFKDVAASGENATITIASRVITITDGSSATAAQIAQAFITGVTVGSAAVSGTLSGYTVVAGAAAAEAVFASSTPNTNVTDLTATVTGDAGALTPVISQGTADNQTYTVIADATALANTNEFAIVFGNEYSCKDAFTPRDIAANQFNAVAFVGKNGALILKERLVKEYALGAGLEESEFEVLRELLKSQGIILETTL